MVKKYSLIVIPLFISLFFYVFYRTEQTVINKVIIYIVSEPVYYNMRMAITGILPLKNSVIVYSLPEGCWVFSATLASQWLFVRIGSYVLYCVYVPLLFAVGLEWLQFFHITNGRFDIVDLGFAVFFWILANNLKPQYHFEYQNIIQPVTTKSVVCFLSYAVVYLAHVGNKGN